MTALFVQPKPFTVVGSSASVAPASNLNQDRPGLVWRTNGLSGIYSTVQLDGSAWDTVALVNSNLRATDTIQIRAGASAAAVAGTSGLALNQTISAYSGTTPASGNAISIYQLPTPITSPFVRIDITSTGNPAGYVQAQRLVIGSRIEAAGLDLDTDWGLEDDASEDGGFVDADLYGTRVSIKPRVWGLSEADYWTKWFPMLRAIGKRKAILCIPDTDPAYLQNQAIFGRVTSSAKATYGSSDMMLVELAMLSTS
ncbi:hypothetical protein [Sphingomonas sp. G-3-2-10]|uniref:hypothetical protein n=1 Tax=Sphingomonas sp. G-3-2-10 TaxID=2728838 RepID=UPI00146F9149|nr:hypothetical protein [Sphingomonas sp. G-3-2-10]NML04265.1 hypothetical protein [Sphingomonas sp. G-3-2-10]